MSSKAIINVPIEADEKLNWRNVDTRRITSSELIVCDQLSDNSLQSRQQFNWTYNSIIENPFRYLISAQLGPRFVLDLSLCFFRNVAFQILVHILYEADVLTSIKLRNMIW